MNFKSILRPMLQTAVGLFLMAQPLSALTFGNFTYTDDGTSITITDYPTSATGTVIIPAAIGGKPVTSIGLWAFNACGGLTSVTIPASVTSIGDYAFYNCSALKSVKTPSNVNYIGNYAFGFCNSLTSVTIPYSITSISKGAFSYCNSLTSMKIPASVTSIGDSTFYGCTGLTSVKIPSNVNNIGQSAFESCAGLTSVTIAASDTSIGESAFHSCSSLTSAKFLGNAPSMGLYVFDSTAPGFTINYFTGKTGFTSPTWNGYPCVGVAPEIDVQQPLGSSLVDGISKKSFGTVTVGTSGTTKMFFIKNTGTGNLIGLAVSRDGANAGNFQITQPAMTSLLPGTSTTFKVTFSALAAGTRNAVIHIKSNDADENPFDIQLTGLSVVP